MAINSKLRQPIIREGFAAIPLTQGKEALVDIADLPIVAGFNWCAFSNGYTWYAVRQSKGARYLMHREIAAPGPGLEVDHKDRNGLDNRRSNLRLARRGQNASNKEVLSRANTSGFRGVSFNKHAKKWHARIKVDGNIKSLGYFKRPEDAAMIYDEAALFFFGEFASINAASGGATSNELQNLQRR